MEQIALEKLTVPRLVKIFPPFYETWRFITGFTKAATYLYPEPDKSRICLSLLFITLIYNLSTYETVDSIVGIVTRYRLDGPLPLSAGGSSTPQQWDVSKLPISTPSMNWGSLEPGPALQSMRPSQVPHRRVRLWTSLHFVL